MRRISHIRGIQSAAARSKQQIMHSFGQILDNLKYGVLQVGVEFTPNRQVDRTTTGKGVEVHRLSRGELFPKLVEIEASEVADLMTLDVDDLNGLPPPDNKRCPF